MTIKLNEDLIDFFDDIKIDYQWNQTFNIDFMDFFPLLKKGITTENTYYKIIASYGLKNKSIRTNQLINSIDAKLIIRVYQQYVFNSETFKQLRDNFSIYLLEKSYSITDNNKIADININDDLLNESNLANSLLATIELSSTSIDDNNDLLKLICHLNPKEISSKILNEVFKKPCIRLLSNVLNNDTEDITIALYIDEIDFYIGYMDLYLLAISRNNIKIANMLKDAMIIKNLYMKRALINNFENLIGPSNIPNLIYDIIK